MQSIHLKRLGDRITEQRIAKHLKQSELAYEAGISERTLQRMEAGEVVKSDGLLKVIAYLGKLDAVLDALAIPDISPYHLVTQSRTGSTNRSARVRVRDSKRRRGNSTSAAAESAPAIDTSGAIVWPEDQT